MLADVIVACGIGIRAIVKLGRLANELPSALAGTMSGLASWSVTFTRECVNDPRKKWKEVKVAVVDEAKHYWVGFKLLWADMKISAKIMGRAASGSRLTRRERTQLVRTSSDMIRLVRLTCE